MDWTTFTPQERAVTVYARRENEVLLIHKKRGLGAGKVNAPGGRIDPGETAAEAAIRETMEEVRLTVRELQQHATLHFAFADGFLLTVYAYVTESFAGTAAQTDEAEPFWCQISDIPYASMWADDALWLPEVLAGRYVDGRFVFDGDSMLSSELTVRER